MKRLVLTLTSSQTADDQQKALQRELDNGYEVIGVINTVSKNPSSMPRATKFYHTRHLILRPKTAPKKRRFFGLF